MKKRQLISFFELASFIPTFIVKKLNLLNKDLYKSTFHHKNNDTLHIKEDWERVGNDIKKAIVKYDHF
ncbi:MAG: hypothetical protein HDS11_02675 [Bacteroides sp.]|nr:hypothetical protein [Bacteroides sp.]